MHTTIDLVERPDWLAPDVYPFTLRRTEVSSGPIVYVDEGSGPTLLFVHAGMWSFVFRDVIAELSNDFRCVTLDFPGSGLTPAHDGIDTVADLSVVLGEFIAGLDLADVTLVVHDLGGLVGIGAAGRDPGRVVGIVVANGFAWEPEGTALRAMLRLMGGPTMTAIDTVTGMIPRMTRTGFGVGRHLDEPSRAAFFGPFRSAGPRRRFHRLIRSVVKDPDFPRTVEQRALDGLSHLPVLSIFGEKNDPFGFQERVAAMWADHEGIVVAGGNHFPMCDDPQLFAGSVRDWHGTRVR
jgi:pimeloyl-ACP methyl ester carboxylesterase